MNKTHTTYLMKTPAGYRKITRRIGKKHAKRTMESMAATFLLVSTIGLCVGIGWSCGTLSSVNADFSTHEGADITPDLNERQEEAQVSSESAPLTSEKQEIINYIVEVFGEDAPDAFNVLYCENRNLDPSAINYNRNGTTDHSIFQINSIHTTRFGDEFITNWRANVDVAKQIFDEQGWTPWTCSTRVGVTNYLGR